MLDRNILTRIKPRYIFSFISIIIVAYWFYGPYMPENIRRIQVGMTRREFRECIQYPFGKSDFNFSHHRTSEGWLEMCPVYFGRNHFDIRVEFEDVKGKQFEKFGYQIYFNELTDGDYNEYLEKRIVSINIDKKPTWLFSWHSPYLDSHPAYSEYLKYIKYKKMKKNE